jgi:hypothetical protein
MKIGRPKRWETREQLISEINEYFDNTPFEEYSVTGLCLYINASKQLLIDYENRDEFKDIIKESKLIVENSYELSLRKHGRTGDIFALKNFGWSDKQEIDHTTKGQAINVYFGDGK